MQIEYDGVATHTHSFRLLYFKINRNSSRMQRQMMEFRTNTATEWKSARTSDTYRYSGGLCMCLYVCARVWMCARVAVVMWTYPIEMNLKMNSLQLHPHPYLTLLPIVVVAQSFLLVLISNCQSSFCWFIFVGEETDIGIEFGERGQL